MKIKKVNEDDLEWEIPAHEDVESPGTWKRVLVRHEEVDPKSKLMMVNLARVGIGKIHPAHAHKTMEEIFYFTEGEGEVRIDEEISKISAGDRVIVAAGSIHEIKNTGKIELKFIGFGIALD